MATAKDELDLSLELATRREAESLAAHLDWERILREFPPAQKWFDGEEPKPF